MDLNSVETASVCQRSLDGDLDTPRDMSGLEAPCHATTNNTWDLSHQTPQQQESRNADNHEAAPQITPHVPGGNLYNCGGGVYAEKPLSTSKDSHLKVNNHGKFNKSFTVFTISVLLPSQ